MYKTEPRPYQKLIVETTAAMPELALFLKQGLGKTKIALDTSAKQYTDNGVDCLIVVSRTTVIENWYYNEIPAHLGVPYQAVLYSASKKGTPIKYLAKDRLKVILINDGCLRRPHGEQYIQDCLAAFKCGLLVDESTLIKNPKAILTKKLLELSKKAVYRRIMCGEPAPQGPTDFYSQYKFLNPQILAVKTFSAFKNIFCEQKEVWVNGRCILSPTGQFNALAQPVFESSVKPFTIKLNKEDVLPDLPEKQYIVKKYHMPEATMKLYDKLRKQFFTELVTVQGTHHLTATLAVSRATRLHQIASGYMVNDQGVEVPVDSGKFEVLKEILDERPHNAKTIIWCHYRHAIENVVQALNAAYGPDSTRLVYGGMGSNDRQNALRDFKEREGVRFLVANPATAGWGLTLTEADTAIYYCNSYNWEHRDQSEDRIHRIGQTSDSVTYYDIVAVGTVDEAVLEVLRTKADFGRSVLQDLSKFFAQQSFKEVA